MYKWMSLVVCVVAACGGEKREKRDKRGSCEFTYAKSSSDGSIVAGTQTCSAKWLANKCTAEGTGAASVGLATKDFIFTAGASCESRGFKACDDTGVAYYRTCPSTAGEPSAAGSSAGANQGSAATQEIPPVASAEQCVGEACAKQGMELLKTDPAKAAAMFDKGCTDQHAISCAMIGISYTEGVGVAKDLARGVEYYKKSCDLGYPKGCHNYGLALANGEGVPADLAQGALVLAKACELGAWKACGSVGDYRVQTGDLAGAKPMLEAGCKNGDTLSCETLAKAFPRAKTPTKRTPDGTKSPKPDSVDPYN